jgi:hypothetical protein
MSKATLRATPAQRRALNRLPHDDDMKLTRAEEIALLKISAAEKMRDSTRSDPVTMEEQIASGHSTRPETYARLIRAKLVAPNVGRGMTLTATGRNAIGR